MAPVPLMFSRGVPNKIDGIKSCMSINVILHASFVENPYRSFTRQFYQSAHKPPAIPKCHHFNNTNPDSRFKQIKYNLGEAGKIQQCVHMPARTLYTISRSPLLQVLSREKPHSCRKTLARRCSRHHSQVLEMGR